MQYIKELFSKSGKQISLVIFESSENPKLTIISSHGGTANSAEEDIKATGSLLDYCQKNNINVFAINFSNNGTHKDQPVDKMLFSDRVKDLETAIDFVEKQYQSPIILIGSSLGGLITLNAANYSPKIKKIILNCPAIKAHECLKAQVDKKEFEQWRQTNAINWGGIIFSYHFWLDIESLNAMKLISNIHKPILIFHGTADQIVPIEQSREAKSLNKYIELIEVEDGGHRLGAKMIPGEWEEKVVNFILKKTQIT